MIRTTALSAALLLLVCLASEAAAADEPLRARANLATFFSDEDYPAEAIRNHEEGTVQFRLSVGADGRPTGCAVTASSGSAILDATTCRIVMERARFTPARDEKGNAVPDEVTARINWRLPDDSGAEADEVPVPLILWSTCLFGEAARLVAGALTPEQVAAHAAAACAPLETLVSERLGKTSVTMNQDSFARSIARSVTEWRARLKAPVVPVTR